MFPLPWICWLKLWITTTIYNFKESTLNFSVIIIVKRDLIKFLCKILLFFAVIFSSTDPSLYSQPETRFDPFDWVLYTKTGGITSLTSDPTYLYAGSRSGGILRYHLFTHQFMEPITRAQGLSSNVIYAVHDAFGILWAATDKGLEYSYSKEGDWRFVSLASLGIPKHIPIQRIGHSRDYIWLMTSSMFYKCDRSTGIMLSLMSFPDEKNIVWSSGILNFTQDPSTLLMEYSVTDGWLYNLRTLISPNGKEIFVTTLYYDNYGDLWVGTSDGTLFYGDKSMKTLTPFSFGLAGNDVQAINMKYIFWVGGRQGQGSAGISHIDPERNIFDRYEFSEVINMFPISIYSIASSKNEVWFGGNEGILVYNQKEDFWRTLGIDRGIPIARILSLVFTEDYLWLGTSRGLVRFDPNSKWADSSEIEKYFSEVFIYDIMLADSHLWIGAETGLFIYDINQGKLYDYERFGYHGKRIHLPPKITHFTTLTLAKNKLYAGSRYGVLEFNLKTRIWSKAVDGSILGGQEIRTLAVKNEQIFIATHSKLIRYNLEDSSMREYHYPFMGEINIMHFSGTKLWMGTTEGLISFYWTKDNT